MYIKFLSLALSIYAGSIGLCEAADIELKLRTSKEVYRLGEPIAFELRFTNRASQPVTFFPDPDLYYLQAITISWNNGRDKVEELQFVERSMDDRGWSRDAVVLRPNETYVRRIDADFRAGLPSDWLKFLASEWRRVTPGRPYLVFLGGSALRLPGFGRYNVVANYDFQRDHPVVEYIQSGPKLWFGKLRSSPIVINLTR
jgi:hypothetical protein